MGKERARLFWAGPDKVILRSGDHHLIPAHLLIPDTEPDLELFMAVTTELGDVVLGLPGTLPADLDDEVPPARVR